MILSCNCVNKINQVVGSFMQLRHFSNSLIGFASIVRVTGRVEQSQSESN